MTSSDSRPEPARVPSLLSAIPELRIRNLAADQLINDLWVPAEFADATLANYIPDRTFKSQAAAVETLKNFLATINTPGRWYRRRVLPSHLYLDGGFGVGKTHLLAAVARVLGPERSRFGSFVEFTQLVGALSFTRARSALSAYEVICIDEFELDDPGDTLMMARMIRELAESDIRVVTTSNTLPEQLGAGRFAAEDFQREIQQLSSQFDLVSIDGHDYRHRSAYTDIPQIDDERVRSDDRWTIDEMPRLLPALSEIHPSRYRQLLIGITALVWRRATPIEHESQGLRLVALVDRAYDAQIPVIITDLSLDELFTGELLGGAYRKKYLRCLSRLAALMEAHPALTRH